MFIRALLTKPDGGNRPLLVHYVYEDVMFMKAL